MNYEYTNDMYGNNNNYGPQVGQFDQQYNYNYGIFNLVSYI